MQRDRTTSLEPGGLVPGSMGRCVAALLERYAMDPDRQVRCETARNCPDGASPATEPSSAPASTAPVLPPDRLPRRSGDPITVRPGHHVHDSGPHRTPDLASVLHRSPTRCSRPGAGDRGCPGMQRRQGRGQGHGHHWDRHGRGHPLPADVRRAGLRRVPTRGTVVRCGTPPRRHPVESARGPKSGRLHPPQPWWEGPESCARCSGLRSPATPPRCG
jgi:hypothetical protein